jgi:DNA-binding response OmpR family regulator
MKILIIEDNSELIEPISVMFKLRWPDCSTIPCAEGLRGVELAEIESPDIIILDINLPDTDGFEVLRRIRLFSDVPIVILTVRGDELDRVRGLEGGADDYIVKPFSVLEFLARVKSAMRRSGKSIEERSEPLVDGDLTVNFESREVMLDGKTVHLTSTEYQILYYLVRSEGRFLNHSTLEQWIWGQVGSVDSSVIRRYIYQLRRKLNDVPPRIIISELGKGYKFVGSKRRGLPN